MKIGSPLEEYKPGILERWGIGILNDLAKRDKRSLGSWDSQEFGSGSKRIIRWTVFWSLQTGFWTTFVIILVEKFFPENPELWSSVFLEKWTWTGLALLLGTVLEFYLLYRIGLASVYQMTRLAGLDLQEDPDLITGVTNLLSRLALEIPDPDLKLLGIDPYRLTNKQSLFLTTLLYKAKVFLSNLVAKIIIRKILARNSFRVYADFVAAPITAVWDAIVLYIILKELRTRLLTRIISKELVEEILSRKDKLSKEAMIGCMTAIGNSVVFTQRFHPNLEYILIKLHKAFQIENYHFRLDEWESFEKILNGLDQTEKDFCLKILSITCCFDGKISSFERKHLPLVFGKDAEERLIWVQKLADAINDGDLESARTLARLD
ncbi:LBF_2804 family protein [Leptospira yasudae]|uniref:Uncharacterized protein n=1 Tax=Leptospira yasudae TaxID=2202201 RepID=A0A6N4QUD8_9LEPT|nr:hypothetical protein [Leptospira yasudae]TGL73888.1 hypothetical protein EHQ72_18635 [Leptospira yasudae]TGL79469.1 hypothetical protein EHQ77_10515 [Leptospira yasudae]TGL84586.1 hypothetical protein EHQ83_10650 [Leptospira yasudae]